jgi:hypothetical protein
MHGRILPVRLNLKYVRFIGGVVIPHDQPLGVGTWKVVSLGLPGLDIDCQ